MKRGRKSKLYAGDTAIQNSRLLLLGPTKLCKACSWPCKIGNATGLIRFECTDFKAKETKDRK